MTREEATEVLRANYPDACYSQLREAVEMAIEALSVEPCEDTISFPKGTLKKRGKGYVVYNPEWLKENWQNELKVMGIECEDAISRADTIEWLKKVTVTDGITFETGFKQILTDIQNMPSVNPKVCFDGMTNGEVIDLLFPNMDIYDNRDFTLREMVFPDEWWDEPYMSENPTGSNCTDCVLDGTDACSRGAGRAVDGRVCEDFVGESED